MAEQSQDRKPDLSNFPRGAISIKGLPVCRNARLPSIRIPRDLTLGAQPKRTFKPNIPVRREKRATEPKVEIRPESSNVTKTECVPPPSKGGRGKGRGRELIQMEGGLFEMGIAAVSKDKSKDPSHSRSGFSSGKKGKADARIMKTAYDWDRLIRDYFIDDESDEEEKQKEKPVIFPYPKKRNKAAPKVKKQKTDQDFNNENFAKDNIQEVLGERVLNLNLEDIKQVLERDPSLVLQQDNRGTSALHLALDRHRTCSAAIVKLLLHYGADPNSKLLFDGPTPLFRAFYCEYDAVGIIRALVEGGARADQPNEKILSAALNRNADIEVIKLLLSAGGDLFSANIHGHSNLFYALKHFDVSVFSSLLDLQDVDINTARNKWNGSLLHSALSMKGCTVVFVQFLIDRGIRVDSVDDCGNTPLHKAARNPKCHPGVVDLLLRKGSLVNVKNLEEKNPMDLAMRKNCNPDIVQLLLKYSLLENPDFDVEDWVRGHEHEGILSRYANDCKCEVLCMNSENVANGRTLLEFLQTYSGNQMNRNGAEGFNVDQILQVIVGKLYPLYSQVISSKLGHSLLKDKLRECNIFTVVRCAKRKVLLDYNCVRILANHLDENDLLSLIMAFCN